MSIVFLGSSEVIATCEDRYATVINPVRGRDRWFEGSLKPIKDQYQIVKETDIPATWLLQDDVLRDRELVSEIKKFDSKQELGLFLEVSPKLAQAARVVYPVNTEWYKPQAVFLSGYERRERERLIDIMIKDFKENFGYVPKSAGAWWIDAYSLEYLKDKYGIEIVLIVTDQKTTDNYGVWGQWWGVPYYADKANVLVPSKNDGMVVVQWALRDPVLAYQGEGPKYSNYSMQANDYRSQGLDIKYFEKLAATYLDCQNKLGQITVGLETGMESVDFINEYKRQLQTIKKVEGLKVVTMSEFATNFRKVYTTNPKEIKIDGWLMTPDFRENKDLGELTRYGQNIDFADYFVADKSGFLDRRLAPENNQKNINYFPYWIAVMVIGVVIMAMKKIKLKYIGGSMIFILLGWGLLLKSYYLFGWKVFFGPVIDNLILWQAGIVVTGMIIGYKLRKYLLGIILAFAMDPILNYLRFSVIEGKYYLGFLIDSFRFVGITNFKLINADFPGYVAESFLKFRWEKVWDSNFLALVIYPLVHVIVGILIALVLKKTGKRSRIVIIAILGMLVAVFVKDLILMDPRIVVAIK